MQQLEGRVAVVTGAASGLGRALAERFAAEGMRVVAADIDEAGLVETASSVTAAGAEIALVPTDVAAAGAVEVLAEATYERFGAAHVVCNNAGVQTLGRIWESPLDDWEWSLGVNLWGVVHGIRSFVPRMLEGGDEGHIVNTSSMAGLIAGGSMAPWRLGIYAATKHAVVAITETLAAELADMGAGIGATVLCPSAIQTHIWDAGRNRPENLQRDDLLPGEAELQETLRVGVEAGRPPAEVAALVVKAIREEQLFVFTDKVAAGRVNAHTHGRVADSLSPE